MTGDDDELDPSDWLAAQFGEEPPAPKPAAAEPAAPPPPVAAVPPATPPYQQPAPPATPTYQQPAAPFTPPPVVAPPAAQDPAAPPAQYPPQQFPPQYPAQQVPPQYPPPAAPQYSPARPQYPAANPTDPAAGSWQLSDEPPVQPAPESPPQASPPPAAPPGGGFSWGLVPGGEPPAEPTPLPYTPPAAPPAAAFGEQTPPTFGEQPPPAAPQFGQPAPATPSFEQPTTAFPAYGEQPTTALPPLGEQPTAALPRQGQQYPHAELEPTAPDPSQWLAAPLDPALDGVTEVFEAELVGLTGPQGEGPGASALDDLFGDGQFRDFSDEPLISPLPPRQGGGVFGGGGPKPPRAPRAPIPRNQKILMWIAGGLVAALALVAIFAISMKLASLAPAPAATPTPSATASSGPVVLALGPVKPGDYHWDQLLGGECLKPFTSAWQDDYTVVDCKDPHPAQLVYRGVFTDPASATYPGLAELQKRINLLCTPATIINYAVAGAVNDIQVTASFAADEDEWDAGNHSYFCFVNRSSGADLTASVAVPQVAPSPTATPSASATPGAPVGRGHSTGTKP